MSDPWARQKGEPLQSFDAFQIYQRMPMRQRSLAKVGNQLGISSTMVERWSAKWAWVSRVAAWEDEQARVRNEQHLAAVAEMSKRHAETAMRSLQALSFPAVALLRRLAAPDADGNPISPEKRFEGMPISDLIDLAATGARVLKSLAEMERTARGLPAETTEVQVRPGGGVNDDLAALIQSNPDAARHASGLLQLLTVSADEPSDAGEGDAGGMGGADAEGLDAL